MTNKVNLHHLAVSQKAYQRFDQSARELIGYKAINTFDAMLDEVAALKYSPKDRANLRRHLTRAYKAGLCGATVLRKIAPELHEKFQADKHVLKVVKTMLDSGVVQNLFEDCYIANDEGSYRNRILDGLTGYLEIFVKDPDEGDPLIDGSHVFQWGFSHADLVLRLIEEKPELDADRDQVRFENCFIHHFAREMLFLYDVALSVIVQECEQAWKAQDDVKRH
jgi:hypothetical protein